MLQALHVINCNYIQRWPLLWSSGQGSWLLSQRSGFDSWRYQIFWEVVGLERGPLSLVSTTEELLGRKSSGSGQENRDYGRRDPPRWPCDTLYRQKLTLTSPTIGGRSVSIVRSRNKATELLLLLLLLWLYSPLFGLCCSFSSLILYTVGRTPWSGDQPVVRPLPTHKATQTQTSTLRVGFEPTTRVWAGRKQFTP
jgi:hypothetical protein